jgi:hypothetical protein
MIPAPLPLLRTGFAGMTAVFSIDGQRDKKLPFINGECRYII